MYNTTYDFEAGDVVTHIDDRRTQQKVVGFIVESDNKFREAKVLFTDTNIIEEVKFSQLMHLDPEDGY